MSPSVSQAAKDVRARGEAARREKRHAEKPRAGATQAKDPRSSKFFPGRTAAERDDEGFAWQIPTNTSNPARPRTKQAGYNVDSRELRVEFRDGTPYTYHGVEPAIWQRFKSSASPGRFINRILNNYEYNPSDDWEP